MTYMALARKWRPKQFSEVMGQTHVIKALSNALDSNRVHHAYLFTGTRGVGKTTLARIFAKSLNCEQGMSSQPCQQCSVCLSVDQGNYVDLIEVDAASRTGIDDMRELLDNVQYAPTSGSYKVYLIDEIHMLSKSSFNALLKTLEEPPEHIKFLFATTDPQKLPVTVLSRCLQFNLQAMQPAQITEQISKILQTEQIHFEPKAIDLLSRAADGSMRDSLSLLEQAIAQSANGVQEEAVRAMLGTIKAEHLNALLQALISHDADNLLATVHDMATYAVDFTAALDQLLIDLHHTSLAHMAPKALNNKVDDIQKFMDYAGQLSVEDVQLLYQIGLISKRDLALAPDHRSGFEMALMRMLAFKPTAAPAKSVSKPALQTQTTPEISDKQTPQSNDNTSANHKNPSADKEPSASKEPSAHKEPSAYKEPLTDKEPSIEKEHFAPQTTLTQASTDNTPTEQTVSEPTSMPSAQNTVEPSTPASQEQQPSAYEQSSAGVVPSTGVVPSAYREPSAYKEQEPSYTPQDNAITPPTIDQQPIESSEPLGHNHAEMNPARQTPMGTTTMNDANAVTPVTHQNDIQKPSEPLPVAEPYAGNNVSQHAPSQVSSPGQPQQIAPDQYSNIVENTDRVAPSFSEPTHLDADPSYNAPPAESYQRDSRQEPQLAPTTAQPVVTEDTFVADNAPQPPAFTQHEAPAESSERSITAGLPAASPAQWAGMIETLNLNGLIRELAMNMSCDDIQGNPMVLKLDPDFQYLHNQPREDSIVKEIQKVRGDGCDVKVEFEKTISETPSERLARLQSERMQATKTGLTEDQGVQDLMNSFDLSMNEASIKPHGT